jgi:hypothetical protein
MERKVTVSRRGEDYLVRASHEQFADEEYLFSMESKKIGNPPIVLITYANMTYTPHRLDMNATVIDYGINREDALKKVHKQAISFGKKLARKLKRSLEDLSLSLENSAKSSHKSIEREPLDSKEQINIGHEFV